ncbi:MAG: Hsp20/alpha crystallin family protein [Gammaproteobacteria bacterium]
MRQNTRLLIISVFLSTLLPVTASGYGFYDAPGERHYPAYAGSMGGHHFSGSFRLQTGMTGDGYYVRAYIKGLAPEDIQVYLRRNRLVLQVAQSDQHGLRDPGARSSSQWQMRVRKQLRLPYDADVTGMTTSTDNGILEIYIPRRSRYLPVDPLLVR